MISATHLTSEVIDPVLKRLETLRPGMYSPKIVQLLLGTAAQESDLGFFLRQHPRGPARGVWQMEEDTVEDLQGRYLMRPRNLDLYVAVEGFSVQGISWYEQLTWNLRLACALARVRYWMVPIPVPEDLRGQARYWDVHYNANQEDEIEEYLASYEEFVTASYL